MTGDDFIKPLVGTLLAALVAAVGWLIRSVVGGREQAIVQALALKVIEGDVGEIRAEINTLKSVQITTECVREVIEEALAKRDKQNDARRADWDELRNLKVREIISQEFEHLVPRIVREIRGDTGFRKATDGKG